MSDDDSLDLGVNETYRDAILHASQRTGMTPQAIAAVIGAEAARGPKGRWNPKSYNKSSGATGLTQFTSKTWLGMARQPGTELSEHVAGLTNRQILDLRNDPNLSIVSAAEYDSDMLAQLQKQGLVPKDLTPTERAQYAYLGHHEGPDRASKILRHKMPQKVAKTELVANVGAAQARKLIAAAGNDAAKAYTQWLNGYIQAKIQPDQFTRKTSGPVPAKGAVHDDPEGSAEETSGGMRIQDGEDTVLIGAEQWKAAHVWSPHEGGGAIAQGSYSVLVGEKQLPFARKGDVTTDWYYVKGDTQPDVFIGGPPASAADDFAPDGPSSSPGWLDPHNANPYLPSWFAPFPR
jgi:hypothetical protein